MINKLKIVLLTMIIQVTGLLASAQSNLFQWKVIDPYMLDIKTNNKYGISNNVAKSFLAYYHRNTGISLAFAHNQTADNITFETEGKKNQSLKYEETFAIHVKGGGYLHYSEREFGINLSYSTNPIYQWKFRNMSLGPQQSKIVSSHDSLVLFNTKNSGYLIYDKRDFGPQLNWSSIHSIGIIPDQSPYYAMARITIRSGPFKIPSEAGKCAGFLNFKFVPIKLTGVNGTEQSYSFGNYYETTQVNTKALEWWCFISESVPKLRPGRWKIIISSSTWSTDCDVDLKNGNNYLTFEQNKSGCTTYALPIINAIQKPLLKKENN